MSTLAVWRLRRDLSQKEAEAFKVSGFFKKPTESALLGRPSQPAPKEPQYCAGMGCLVTNVRLSGPMLQTTSVYRAYFI